MAEEMIFALRLAGVLAALCAAVAGWRLFMFNRRVSWRVGNVLFASAVAWLAWLALMPQPVDRPKGAVAVTFRDFERVECDDEPAPLFWASSIGSVYHLPTCRYAGSVRHGLGYDTEEEVICTGRRPCKYCLGETHVSLK